MIGNNYISGMMDVAKGSLQSARLGQMNSQMANMNAVSQYTKSGANKDVKSALVEFEGMFISELMKMVYNTVPVDKNFGGGLSEETYREMLVNEYSLNMAKHGGLGIADKIMDTIEMRNSGKVSGTTLATVNSAYTKL